MSVINSFGLIGYGKMGRDIFDCIHSKMPDTRFVIFYRHDSEAEKEKVLKNLSKALKRKKVTEEDYEKLTSNFSFTDSYSDFSDCDFILESVTENLGLKQSIFSELDKTVKKECVFATNTSSLNIRDIFTGCSKERKISGLHFFYPVKFSKYIELNDCDDESFGKAVADAAGKNTVSLKGDYSIYLNQFISFCISHALLLADRYGIGIKQSMNILSELFPMHSLFGMVDSIGTGLLTHGGSENKVQRIRQVLDFGRNRLQSFNDDGCSPETGMFLQYIDEKEKDISGKEADTEAFVLDMVSAVINEAVQASSEADPKLADALCEAVGLAETFAEFYSRYGYEKITESLKKTAEYSGFDSYTPADISKYSLLNI